MGKQSDELARALHRVLIAESRHRREPEWHPTLVELEAYCKGELSAPLKEELRDHLVICHGCSDLLLVCRDSPDLQAEFADLQAECERFLNPDPDNLILSESESGRRESWREFIEADLLQRIRERLSPELEARYKSLVLKRDSESLTPAEYEELLSFSNQIEGLEVQRLEALVRLAKLREVPFEALIKELGLQPDSNG